MRTTLVSIGFSLLATFIAADDAMSAAMKVSCIENGVVILNDDLPDGVSQKEKRAISNRYPRAMCVFLTKNEGGDLTDAAGLGRGQIGDTVLDSDLATALSMISGSKARVRSSKAKPAVKAPETHLPKTAPVPDGAPRVNLALGVYKNVTLKDVMAHWKVMAKGTSIMARLTPTVAVEGDVALLSVEGVPDELADSLCREAEQNSVGCLAFY